jgi:hypothetical protein
VDAWVSRRTEAGVRRSDEEMGEERSRWNGGWSGLAARSSNSRAKRETLGREDWMGEGVCIYWVGPYPVYMTLSYILCI